MPDINKTIAVIFGGRSAEHDVSIITAHTPIIDSLKAAGGYEIVPIYIAKDGRWYSEEAMNDLSYFRSDLETKLAELKPLELSIGQGLTIIRSGWRSKKIKIDTVFPAMHGTLGEDGSLMGLLRMAGVPFVGCDLFASAVAMDKVLTKEVLAAEEVPIVPYVWCAKHEWENNRNPLVEKIKPLSWPLFVKPVHLGSSIGITKAADQTALDNALEVAFHYDDKVLVEEAVPNLIEVTLPIMGNDEPRLASIERPLNKTEFFDFNDKYLSGSKTGSKKGGGANTNYSEIPAQIAPELAQKVEEYGRATYRILGCSGIARVDFLIDSAAGNVYVNEVNTLPGSLYHHNWKKSGVSNIELVTGLIRLAEEKFISEQKLTRTFASEVLKRAGGPKLS